LSFVALLRGSLPRSCLPELAIDIEDALGRDREPVGYGGRAIQGFEQRIAQWTADLSWRAGVQPQFEAPETGPAGGAHHIISFHPLMMPKGPDPFRDRRANRDDNTVRGAGRCRRQTMPMSDGANVKRYQRQKPRTSSGAFFRRGWFQGRAPTCDEACSRSLQVASRGNGTSSADMSGCIHEPADVSRPSSQRTNKFGAGQNLFRRPTTLDVYRNPKFITSLMVETASGPCIA
jgi:hypothetical protein